MVSLLLALALSMSTCAPGSPEPCGRSPLSEPTSFGPACESCSPNTATTARRRPFLGALRQWRSHRPRLMQRNPAFRQANPGMIPATDL